MTNLTVITGHTAAGKTTRALALAKKQKAYIISVDSRQLYRGLDIVTGKDIPPSSPFTQLELWEGKTLGYYNIEGVDFWGYDLTDPTVTFSSYEFFTTVEQIITRWGDSRPLVLVGGSYLYLKHVLDGFHQTDEPDPIRRVELDLLTIEELQRISKEDYGEQFDKLNQSDRHNPRRLIRLIEKGDSVGEWQPGLLEQGFELYIYEGRYIQDRIKRQEQIMKRVLSRIEQGAVEETKKLLERYHHTAPGLNTLGYTQINNYLQGRCSKQQMIVDWVTAEIQYAKKQLTFMRKDPRITWQDVGSGI
ncbi:MAG: tRNA dimethylallyltransferase [Microgenomates bacterium OLB22]|nr:MAG: tRNA dimethylallyltransferase [Microgenomates bacterium OLB22]